MQANATLEHEVLLWVAAMTALWSHAVAGSFVWPSIGNL